MQTTLPLAALCAIAALTGGCVDGEGIVSSDTLPSVDLTNGGAVCADEGINSIAASEIEWWLHSSPDAGLDKRITAALEVSIRASASTFHSGTATTCESREVGIAFVQPDGSVNERARLTAHFAVTASPDGSAHVAVDRPSLLAAAQELIELQHAELNHEKLTAID